MQNTENLVSVDAYKNEALYPIEPSNHESWQIIAAVENVYNLYLTFEWFAELLRQKSEAQRWLPRLYEVGRIFQDAEARKFRIFVIQWGFAGGKERRLPRACHADI